MVRALLSTIGSRGDVQPLVALASQLSELGQEVRFCVPPDFRGWVDSLGFPVVPIGPELRPIASSSRSDMQDHSSPERRRRSEDTVAAQFATIPEAARGCDVLLGFGALQIAARSVAELLGIRYVHATFCPITLPSALHAPPLLPGWEPDRTAGNRGLWAQNARHWNDSFGAALNTHRAAAGLAPVDDVYDHMITNRPWLAADPTLAPWPEPNDPSVVRMGAWILSDERPLSAELEAFLIAGEPPVYFGLGSMPAPREDVSRVVATAARMLGRRVIVSRGWAELSLADNAPDCVVIGETNLQALFQRVAAVVHHGGSGTTTAAARAGAPQVAMPQWYDQYYWAQRIEHLGIGAAHQPGVPTVDSLATALSHALRSDVVARAHTVAAAVRTDGARIAAQRLMSLGSAFTP